jgi:hypothetical protein
VGELVENPCVKTTSATPEAGQVVETVTQRRVLPATEVAAPPPKGKISPDFWDYLETLKPADWDRHLLYIYRRDSDSGPTPQLEKCVGTMVMPDGSRVYLGSREETEFAIVQKYGGGTYRLILKRDHERLTETRVVGEGPRKNVQLPLEYGGGPTVSSMGDATADVANHAISTIAGQERQAVDVAVNALRGASDVIQRLSQPPAAPVASATDDLMKLALVKMLERALNPPDPLELLTKLLTLMNQLNGSGGAGGGGAPPMVQKILDTAVEKLLNPPPSGPVSSASAELVRQLPAVASYASEALAQWRAGVEAQRDTAAIMRGVPAPARLPGSGPAAPGTIVPPSANGSAEGAMPGAPSLEFIEGKIVEIIREPSLSAVEAAENVFAFIETVSPLMLAQLKSLGEAGIFNLFQSRPVLRTAATNVPRLQDFIREFLKFAGAGDPVTGAASLKPN